MTWRYDVAIPDLDYFLKQIDCRDGCPVKTDPRAYMLAIHRGDLLEGYKIARGPNPFASICGMICGAPCENACRRDRVDKTLTIRAQKRYLDEWFGQDQEALNKSLEYSYARGSTNPEPNGLRVACVGAGVASLSAAHDLLRVGYAVDVYEQMKMPGGMLTYGVPTYRLNNKLAITECNAIAHLGANIIYETKVGRDITMEQLQDQYDAIFLGVGLWKSRELPIPGADRPDVIRGVEYLKVKCAEREWKIGKKMVVIGGGNVAFDVARTSARNGAEKVIMIAMEARDEQTADEFEIEDGIEEGVELLNRIGPVAIERDEAGKIIGVRCQRVYSLFDADKRFAPKFVPDSEFVIPCDCVALAIGQSLEESWLNGWSKRDELVFERGAIKAERGTCRTSVPHVYSGGDAAFGAALFITAIKHGQEAARAIDEDLRGLKPYQEYVGEFTQVPAMRDKTYLRTKWKMPTNLNPEDRVKNVSVVENNYTETEARAQANRCLQCHTSPVFDGSLCIKCNGCIDVCPTNCLALISVDQMKLHGDLKKAANNFYGVDTDQISDGQLAEMGSAIIKDEDLCIRCGLCAEKCPTQAVTMDTMNYSFRWLE